MKRDWDSFVSIRPNVEDVFDDDTECGQRAQGDADVSQQRVRDDVGNYQTTSRPTDPNAEIANGVGEHELFGGLNLDGRVLLFEFAILSQEFRDERTSLHRNRIFAMLDGEVQECDELVSGGSVEVERQDVFHWMWDVRLL